MYNVLGEAVGTLIDQYLAAGTHQSTFHAGGLASGIYFYTLTAGDVQLSKKMIVIK